MIIRTLTVIASIAISSSSLSLNVDGMDCEKAWKDYFQYSDVGEYILTETVTKTTVSGTETTTKTQMRQTVTAKSEENQTVDIETVTKVKEQTTKSTYSMTKSQFLQGCQTHSSKTIAEGEEEVTVPAGTFQTKWSEYKYEEATYTTTGKAFVATLGSGDQLLVKALASTVFQQGNSNSDTYLIETNRN